MSKAYLNNQTYFKQNYDDALKVLVPKYLIEDDISNFGTENEVKDLIINSHIDIASNFSSILNVSNVAGTIYSSINTFAGIAPYFIKQNKLSDLRPDQFERRILDKFDVTIGQFNTSSEFKSYLDSTVLPQIKLNSPGSNFTHSGLIRDLSWLYFLNTSGSSYSPSSYVSDLLASKLYYGKPIHLDDCIKGLTEHVWKNSYTSYYPSIFVSSTDTYLSGTQSLDKLKTWVGILYSPLYADQGDFLVKERFELYLTAGLKVTGKTPSGPITKLLRLIGFAAFDSNDSTELIESLYSIDDCPDEYLPYVADLIGWRLFGSNPERWRLQLRNAVEVYKRVGTKKALQFALNTVFPKDQFQLESRVTELWESYIPYLIYYSLATESSYLQSQEDWTWDLASRLGVNGYSVTSLDENIRMGVDKILLDTYNTFRSHFNFPNKADKYNYRGRQMPIPPFEEYPYYVNVELSDQMIDFIVDRIACFGVRQEFALQVRDYINSNTLEVDEEVRSSSWLFFTSGYNSPPNLDNLVLDLNNKKFEYASLWSGKSSHFKLIFDASEFDFSNKDESDIGSGDAIQIASDIVNEFSPAHSIPLISLQLSSVDSTLTSDSTLPIVDAKIQEPVETSKIVSNYYTSGLHLNAYTRNNTSGNKFNRNSLTNVDALFFTSKSPTGAIPRNAERRRSFEKIMPMYGYYDRTGFNMPVSFDPSASLSGFTLGFIPSSLRFQSISDAGNLPTIYQQCINSSANIYGYPVSATLKCRGHVPLLGNNYYTDRGQLPDIYAVMHSIAERKKWYDASAYLTSANLLDLTWKNVYGSFANSATSNLNWFPSAVTNFYNFQFGRDIHTLYKLYTKEFDRHRLAEDIQYLDGPNIFSHTFGSIVYNHDFDLVNPSYVTSSFDSSGAMYAGVGPFSIVGGAYIASSTSDVKIYPVEYVNSGIVFGVDLVQPSSNSTNYIAVFKAPGDQEVLSRSPYMLDKTFLILNGNSRIRFDIKNPTMDSNQGYPISKNFLLPNHDYNLKLKYSMVSEDGTTFGNSPLAVWIHTKPENSKIWSWTKDGNWVQHDYNPSTVGVTSFLNSFTIPVSYSEKVKTFNELSGTSRFQCINLVDNPTEVSRLYSMDEGDFVEQEINFNTYNNNILFDRDYGLSYGSVHRKSQNYVIEILHFNSTDRNLVLDTVNLIDSTMNKMSQYLVLNTCPQTRIPLSRSELRSIFTYFNNIAGKNSAYGIASRDQTETSGVFFASGGSRLDYRFHQDTLGTATGSGKDYEFLGVKLILQELEIGI